MLVFISRINLKYNNKVHLLPLLVLVGSGKSSILAALLGEMNKVHGHVSIKWKNRLCATNSMDYEYNVEGEYPFRT